MGKRLRSSPCPAAAQPLLRPPSPQALPPPAPRLSAAWRRCPRAGALRGRLAAGGGPARAAPRGRVPRCSHVRRRQAAGRARAAAAPSVRRRLRTSGGGGPPCRPPGIKAGTAEASRARGGAGACPAGPWLTAARPAATCGWSGSTVTGATSAATTCTTRRPRRSSTSWRGSASSTAPASTGRNSTLGTRTTSSGTARPGLPGRRGGEEEEEGGEGGPGRARQRDRLPKLVC